jgi:hypothetical protein
MRRFSANHFPKTAPDERFGKPVSNRDRRVNRCALPQKWSWPQKVPARRKALVRNMETNPNILRWMLPFDTKYRPIEKICAIFVD